jgi:DMSO/TMAO reductase YedYZ molybdopterin-dependent catalytic subunit
MKQDFDRRRFLAWLAAAGGAAAVSGCDRVTGNASMRSLLAAADAPTDAAMRALVPDDALAPEFTEADLSPVFKANGSLNPKTPEYLALLESDFADYRLTVSGLVERPQSLDLASLRAMPSRTQITRHDCVEGWSCIGKWKGVPIARVLELAGPTREARFLVFRCADSLDGDEGRYYESVRLSEARHPQSLLAYDMNDAPLTVPHGAPLRARLERKLGYKMAKYIVGLELVASLEGIGGGQGGYWEDRGYQWHAGI